MIKNLSQWGHAGEQQSCPARIRDTVRFTRPCRAVPCERILSEWNPDGALSAVNRGAGRAPVKVPVELLAVVKTACPAAPLRSAVTPSLATLVEVGLAG